MPGPRHLAAGLTLFAILAAGQAVGAPVARADDPPIPETTSTEAPSTAAAPTAAAALPAAPSALPLRPGATGWRVTRVQERLQWLGYPIRLEARAAALLDPSTGAAVRALQAKFGRPATGVVGPVTWHLLTQLARTPGRLPAACRAEESICIDLTTRLVRHVVDGRPTLTMDARFGTSGEDTRVGSFRVQRKSRDHVSSRYGTAMPFALFFSGGQAVHYSPYFARDGYAGGSHGCVNLRDFTGARRLFDHVRVGTRVLVYRS